MTFRNLDVSVNSHWLLLINIIPETPGQVFQRGFVIAQIMVIAFEVVENSTVLLRETGLKAKFFYQKCHYMKAESLQ